ncbi:hypothetical protein JCM8097_001557 [Rhodosporidiobolus ruineniae]
MSYQPRHSAMPATPRATSTYTSTTPRSARRVLASSTSAAPFGTPSRPSTSAQPLVHPPLPPINTRVYPDRPYADDDELRDLLDQDRDAVDTAVSLLEHSLAAHKKRVFEERELLGAEKVRLEKETRAWGEQAKELSKTLQREREELEHNRTLEAQVQAHSRSLKVQVETAHAEVKEALSKLEARRDLKAKQRAAFAKQVSRNGPELEFFETKLGLKIRGKTRDVVQFKFQNVDPASFTRSFAFDLDASKPTYTLAALHPPSFLPPSVLAPLLSKLNASRDLYAFVRAMRGAFVDEIGVEKRLGPGAAEEERAVERGRVRAERA